MRLRPRPFTRAGAQGSAPPAAAADIAAGSSAFGTVGGLSAANGATGRRPAARAGNVRSLGDLAADEDDDDSEEDGDETNELYTGGAKRYVTPCLPVQTCRAILLPSSDSRTSRKTRANDRLH